MGFCPLWHSPPPKLEKEKKKCWIFSVFWAFMVMTNYDLKLQSDLLLPLVGQNPNLCQNKKKIGLPLKESMLSASKHRYESGQRSANSFQMKCSQACRLWSGRGVIWSGRMRVRGDSLNFLWPPLLLLLPATPAPYELQSAVSHHTNDFWCHIDDSSYYDNKNTIWDGGSTAPYKVYSILSSNKTIEGFINYQTESRGPIMCSASNKSVKYLHLKH